MWPSSDRNGTYGKRRGDFRLRIADPDSTRGANPRSAIVDPQLRGLFPAYYSSSCGGHTTSSEEVFGDSFGPLKGVPCPYCKEVTKLELFYWPMAAFDRVTVTKQLLERYPKLEALGEITDIATTEESCYGDYARLRRIRLTGATGKTDTLRAEDLRLALDPSGRKIKSAICRIVPWGRRLGFRVGPRLGPRRRHVPVRGRGNGPAGQRRGEHPAVLLSRGRRL